MNAVLCKRGVSSFRKYRFHFSRSFNSGISLTPKIPLPHASFKTESRFSPTIVDGEFFVSPPLLIPKEIVSPPYASRKNGTPDPLPDELYGEVKSQQAIEKMRKAGVIASRALQLALDSTRPGSSLISILL